jgi:hypothetical protein
VGSSRGGDQPVAAGPGAFGGGDGDLGVDDPDAQGADRGEPGTVAVAGDHGQATAVLAADQQVGVGRGEGGEEVGGGVITVGQQQHAGFQVAGQCPGLVEFAGGDRVEDRVDDRPGPAGQ